ncbi:MAG: right-handed parallel beta-helix repeat-containing protein, partial [Lachnospiraceae bacterium]|nr:right-handed parallel beta-helix repeat-containing protein [Lachnospiraceae bacterium]
MRKKLIICSAVVLCLAICLFVSICNGIATPHKQNSGISDKSQKNTNKETSASAIDMTDALSTAPLVSSDNTTDNTADNTAEVTSDTELFASADSSVKSSNKTTKKSTAVPDTKPFTSPSANVNAQPASTQNSQTAATPVSTKATKSTLAPALARTGKPSAAPVSTKAAKSTAKPVITPAPVVKTAIPTAAPQNSISIASDSIICSSSEDIQNALKNVNAGQTIYIKNGTYSDLTLKIRNAGTNNSYISLKNYPGEKPVFKNTKFKIYDTCHYMNIEGLTIKAMNASGTYDFCMRLSGGCSDIKLTNIEFSNITCSDPATGGISVLSVSGDSETPISNITISNCNIHDCTTGRSEAITIKGNTTDCVVSNCTINNTGNIGIDIAGNYSGSDYPSGATNQARNILVTKNRILNCTSPNASSAGIYSDGARNITFSYNMIQSCHCGISLGAEESGADVYNSYVYNNLIVNCGRGIAVGGYKSTSAKHYNSYIYNNTIVCSDMKTLSGSKYGITVTNTSNLNFY